MAVPASRAPTRADVDEAGCRRLKHNASEQDSGVRRRIMSHLGKGARRRALRWCQPFPHCRYLSPPLQRLARQVEMSHPSPELQVVGPNYRE